MRFSQIGVIPPEGKIFFVENFDGKKLDKVFFFVPSRYRELAEAIVHFRYSVFELKSVIDYLNYELEKSVSKIVFLDVGANQGLYSIFFLQNGFRSIACEGNHDTVSILKINYLLNGHSEKDVIDKWVVPSLNSSYTYLNSESQLTNGLAMTQIQSNHDDKSMVTLNYLLEEFHPRVLKIDIEGLDVDLLLSAERASLAYVDYLIIELEFGSGPAKMLYQFLEECNFKLFREFDLNSNIIKTVNSGVGNAHFVKEKWRTNYEV